MNQCACACHVTGFKTVLTCHPAKSCCDCSIIDTFRFTPSPAVERHDDIVAKRIIEIEQKLEAQQKEIEELKILYDSDAETSKTLLKEIVATSRKVDELEKQRDIGMEQIKRLEDEVRNPNPNLLKYFGDSIELGLARKSIPEIVDRMEKLESKLAEQEIKFQKTHDKFKDITSDLDENRRSWDRADAHFEQIEERLAIIESKLAQQNPVPDLSQLYEVVKIIVTSLVDQEAIQEPDFSTLVNFKLNNSVTSDLPIYTELVAKKTKTLWIAVDKKPNHFCIEERYETTSARSEEKEIDRVILDLKKEKMEYVKCKIEIEVEE